LREKKKRTAVMLASERGHIDVVHELISAGADLQMQDVVGSLHVPILHRGAFRYRLLLVILYRTGALRLWQHLGGGAKQ
jgi:ankyrin repeat protein